MLFRSRAVACDKRLGAQIVYIAEYGEAGNPPVAARREVEAGVTLQGLTEIRSGLNAGEMVIVQGQQLLSGSETLRIIGAGQ